MPKQPTPGPARKPAKVPSAPPSDAIILTVPEAAYLLRCSADLVYDLIRRGDLSTTRVGRKRFVPRRAIGEYVDRQTTVMRPEAARAVVPPSRDLREAG